MQYLGQHLCLHKHPSSDIYCTGNFGDKGCKTAGTDSLIALKTLNVARLSLRGTLEHHKHSSLELIISQISLLWTSLTKKKQMTTISSLSATFLKYLLL